MSWRVVAAVSVHTLSVFNALSVGYAPIVG